METQETLIFRCLHKATGLDAGDFARVLDVSRGHIYNVLGGSQQPSARTMREAVMVCQDMHGFADGLLSDFRALPDGKTLTLKITSPAQEPVIGRFLARLTQEEWDRVVIQRPE